jgi:hypothetical protein
LEPPWHFIRASLISPTLSSAETTNWFHLRLVPIDWRWLPVLIRILRLFGSLAKKKKKEKKDCLDQLSIEAVGTGRDNPCWSSRLPCPMLYSRHE